MGAKRIERIEELENSYYLYGDEELLMEESLERLKELFSRNVDPDFNIEVLDAGEVSADQIIDRAETVPLLSERRLVIVREVDRLSPADQDRLAGYVKAPNPATSLVLVSHFRRPGENIDASRLKRIEGSRLFKAVRENGKVLQFTMGSIGRARKLEQWVVERFKRRGKRISADARDYLIEAVGTDLRILGDAIERICLFTGERDSVSRGEVESVVMPVAEHGVFGFVDAVADRRRDLSLYRLNKLVRQGESPARVFGLLLRQFRLIARAKALTAGGEHSAGEIASSLGVPPFVASKCIEQSRRFSSDRLRSIFGEFKRTQLELYSSRYLEERDYQSLMLEILITRIIG